MYVRKVKKATGKPIGIEGCRRLMVNLESAIQKKGYDNDVDAKIVNEKNCSFNIRAIRLSRERIARHGHNISPFSGRRGDILGWNDWVRVNNTINRVMNTKKLSGTVDSLAGKFKVREGTESFTKEDWESAVGYENVGSMMHPCNRIDAWRNEKDMTKEEIAHLKGGGFYN